MPQKSDRSRLKSGDLKLDDLKEEEEEKNYLFSIFCFAQ